MKKVTFTLKLSFLVLIFTGGKKYVNIVSEKNIKYFSNFNKLF